MTRALPSRLTALRHVLMTLAMLAVAIRVAVPVGFMVAPPSAGQSIPIVLCTGKGVVSLEAGKGLAGPDTDHKAPDRGAHDSPCVFSGHGVVAPPPSAVAASAPVFVDYAAPRPTTPPGLTPGRGLTGPPLSARGPPALLI